MRTQSLPWIVIGLLALIQPATARAADFSFAGSFNQDDDVQLFTFTVTSTSTIAMRTWSYAGGSNAAGQVIPAGGFDPNLSAFQSDGTLVFLNNDGTGTVAVDPTSGNAFDSYGTQILTAGTYTLALTESDNSPNGSTFAQGFSEQGQGNFTGPLYTGNPGSFIDIGIDQRNPQWAVDILNVASASTVPAPEPATVALLGGALFAAAIRRRRS